MRSVSAIRLNKVTEHLFPRDVITEGTTLPGQWENIYSQEQMHISHACAKRRSEFIAGRICARRALARLGVSNFPVQRKKCGQPVWPNGITGSISHCSDYCCVAVGQEKEYISIGLDVEKIKPLEVSIWNYICTNEEQFWLHSLVPEKQHIGVLLLFSAKECYFKYQFPLTTQWLDFHDVRVRIKSDLNEFEVIFTDGRDQALKVVTGRYVVTQHHIFTGIAQPTLSEQEHS